MENFQHSQAGLALTKNWLPIHPIAPNIFFCLPQKALATALAIHAENAEDKVSKLKKELVAIKIVDSSTQYPADDFTFLKEVSKHADNEPGAQRCVRLLDYDSMYEGWLIMPAITSSLSVDGMLEKTRIPTPLPFVFHFFIEVITALIWLHDTCKIVHHNLHLGNVVIDTSGHQNGLPNLVLIDFGLTMSITEDMAPWEKDLELGSDREGLCRCMTEIFVYKRTGTRRRFWLSCDDFPSAKESKDVACFLDCMKHWVTDSNTLRIPCSLASMWGLFEDLAIDKRGKITDQVRLDLEKVIWLPASVNENMLMDAIESHLSSPPS